MPNYISYVNICQGSKSVPRFSNGNTLPLTQRPFAMVSFAPQTEGGTSWWFHPDVPSVEGIRLTHQPSPWIADYGMLLMTPQSDVIADAYPAAWSGYRRKDAVLRPDYMKINFLRSKCSMEVAPTERCASVRATFDTELGRCITLFNIKGDAEFEVRKDGIYGCTDARSGMDYAENFKMYFVLKPQNDWIDTDACRVIMADGKQNGIHLAVKDGVKECKYNFAISYISFEQAEWNLKETEGKDFDAIRAENEKIWEDYLAQIEITADEKTMKTFYSCMYRTGLYPHMAYETTPEGEAVHYSPNQGKTCPGVRYTDNGFWDTYRTEFPLFSLLKPELYRDVLESVLNDYREGGFLPRWVSIGEVGCMPSTLLDSIIAQAATCGIADGQLLKDLLEAMKHHANHKSEDARFGRTGIEAFVKLGYVPYDQFHESVNLTLDFAYGDYCIAKVAEKAGDSEAVAEYTKRGQYYRNIFDSETGFMRAKHTEGGWRPDFDPYSWGADYTEASAWQTTFSVPHDLDGLAELFGGKDALLKRLDDIFSLKPDYRVGGYGIEIHEMTEMAAVDFGLCAISNQPSFLLPYIYAYFGEMEKTQKWVKHLCDNAFSYEDDGFPGDEDNGTTAAWYIFGQLGLYPVCPADDRWVKIPALVEGKVNGVPIEEWKKKIGK